MVPTLTAPVITNCVPSAALPSALDCYPVCAENPLPTCADKPTCAEKAMEDENTWALFAQFHSATEVEAEAPPTGTTAAATPAAPTTRRAGRGANIHHGDGHGGMSRRGIAEADMQCESCQSTDLIIEDGQHVCRQCCRVNSRIIDNGAEWRFYGVDDSRGEDPTRCGMPTDELLPGSSLGSMVGGHRYDNRDMRRIRQFQMWNSMPYWERELYRVFEKLSSATTNNGIPSKVLGDSKVLYSRASEMKISRGDNKEGLIASCIFYACAMNGVPRSTTEIAAMFNIHPTVLTKGNSRFQTLMKLNIQSPNAVDFISRFASQLRMNWNDIEECQDLTLTIEEMEIVSENAPTSVAAGTLYFFCMTKPLDIPKKQVASVCNVSEVTITKCYKNLMKYKEYIFEGLKKIKTG